MSKVNISFTWDISKEENEEFENFYDETTSCECATLGGLCHFILDQTSWNREKIKSFLIWFVLEGLREGWLVSKLGF